MPGDEAADHEFGRFDCGLVPSRSHHPLDGQQSGKDGEKQRHGPDTEGSQARCGILQMKSRTGDRSDGKGKINTQQRRQKGADKGSHQLTSPKKEDVVNRSGKGLPTCRHHPGQNGNKGGDEQGKVTEGVDHVQDTVHHRTGDKSRHKDA